ncbi:hypothetical protein Xentx_03042 [Xenorhabdus thuongxuanensis]|uniref:Uncharacterized protein n=1 Tax=Xenorhabdus thuongxuanensis TaxID=1873484 RepID=A0A1Q5TSJ8_9GAMM|nr:hypothetical protein Xentx_03042 [Xenorhabdus thuongxuanensis]
MPLFIILLKTNLLAISLLFLTFIYLNNLSFLSPNN